MPYYLAWLEHHLATVDHDRNRLPGPIFKLASFVDVVSDALNGGLLKMFRGNYDRMFTVGLTAAMLKDAGHIEAAALMRDAQVVYQRAFDEVDDLTKEEEARAQSIEGRLLPILSEHAAATADAYVQQLAKTT